MADGRATSGTAGQFHAGIPRGRHSSTMMSGERHLMRNRVLLFSFALAAFTIAILLFEAHAGTPTAESEHCGFWTTIEAGLSCR